MRNKLIYGILICIANHCYAQKLPSVWLDTTGMSGTITKTLFNFKKDFLTIDAQPFFQKNKDAIGIFVKNPDSTSRCVGYKILDTTSSQTTVNAMKRAAGPYGYVPGDIPEVRYWNNALNCQYLVKIDTSYTFNGKSDTVYNGTGTIPDVGYLNGTFLTGAGSAAPTYIKNTDIIFSNDSLAIDSLTGTIDLQRSLPGTYTVKFKSTFCLRKSSQQITIQQRIETDSSKIDIKDLKYDNLPATCEQKGSIFIKSSSIKGKQPFTYHLTNNTDNSLLTNGSGVFGEVKEGIYTLAVSDSAGNTATYPATITINKVGDCYNTVLKPDGKDGVQSLYIPDVGHAKILNRNGEVIKLLSIPAEWNCDDAQGKPVPMGDYYLFINETQSKVITVLR